jgi:hypothetical protein
VPQDAEVFKVKAGGICSFHCIMKDEPTLSDIYAMTLLVVWEADVKFNSR